MFNVQVRSDSKDVVEAANKNLRWLSTRKPANHQLRGATIDIYDFWRELAAAIEPLRSVEIVRIYETGIYNVLITAMIFFSNDSFQVYAKKESDDGIKEAQRWAYEAAMGRAIEVPVVEHNIDYTEDFSFESFPFKFV